MNQKEEQLITETKEMFNKIYINLRVIEQTQDKKVISELLESAEYAKLVSGIEEVSWKLM